MPMHPIQTINTQYPPLIQTIQTQNIIMLQAPLTLHVVLQYRVNFQTRTQLTRIILQILTKEIHLRPKLCFFLHTRWWFFVGAVGYWGGGGGSFVDLGFSHVGVCWACSAVGVEIWGEGSFAGWHGVSGLILFIIKNAIWKYLQPHLITYSTSTRSFPSASDMDLVIKSVQSIIQELISLIYCLRY